MKLLEKIKRGLSSPFRVKPNLLLIGAQKSGSTSLYNYLSSHPFVADIHVKEINYFSDHYKKGLLWYKAFFPTKKEYKKKSQRGFFIIPDGSCKYLHHSLAAERCKKQLGESENLKFIVMLRNPVDRAYSQYEMAKRRYERGDKDKHNPAPQVAENFEEAIKYEIAGKKSPYKHRFLEKGFYMKQLEPWLKNFKKENFLFIISEDFFANPYEEYLRTLDFLKLPEPENLPEFKNANKGKYVPLSQEMRIKLEDYFRESNKELADFLKRDLPW